MDHFFGEPELIAHNDGIHWTVAMEFAIDDDILGRLSIPNGFVTDLGSIPKIFQNIISPEGKPLRAYLGHDWLYAVQKWTRKQSDDCLMRMMYALDVPLIERWTIYLAVRAFGGSAWSEDKRKLNVSIT